MKALGIAVLVVVGVLGLGAVSAFVAFSSMYNQAITYENDIKRLNSESEATLSSVTVKLQNAVGLNSQYIKGLKDVVTAAVQGRYGDKGSQATFQWIQEQNPNVSDKVFLKVHDILDGGGTEFKISQNRKIEVCTNYDNFRGTLVRGFFMNLSGFPKRDVDDMCKVISDEATATAFKTGKQEAVIKTVE